MFRWRSDSAWHRGIGPAAIAAAFLSRIGMAAVFAVWVALALSGKDAARMYQLMFLQGGLIALLSASAYARGAHLASSGVSTGATARRFLRFLTLSSAVSFALGLTFVPTGVAAPQNALVMGAFVVGAAASAFNGLIQGVVVARAGPVAAFAPSIAASLAGSLALAGAWLADPQDLAVASFIWALPQVLAPCLLLRSPVHRQMLFERGAATADVTAFAPTGAVNAGSVAAGYVFRERWTDSQSAEISAQGFMIVRITELAYQVFYMGAASFPRLVERFFTARLKRPGSRRWVLSAAAMTTLPVVVLSLLQSGWSTFAALAAEAMLIPARVLATLCLLALLARPSMRAYQWALLASIITTAAIMWVPAVQASPLALQALQAINSWVIVTATALTFSTRSRPGRRNPGKQTRPQRTRADLIRRRTSRRSYGDASLAQLNSRS